MLHATLCGLKKKKERLYFIKKWLYFPVLYKNLVFLLNIFCQLLNSSMVIIDLFFLVIIFVFLLYIYVCVCVCVYFKAMVLFSWVPESLWTMTTAMKLKDTCFLEEKNMTNLDSVLKSRQPLV